MAVGLVISSERELNRIELLSQVTQGRMAYMTGKCFGADLRRLDLGVTRNAAP